MNIYLQRCIELAQLGASSVQTNPLVGSVIVHNDKIIGEGFHKFYGEKHAEVNAIESVKDPTLLKESTIYVSLEPCCITGKTPPCTDLILKHQIPKVVVGSKDLNPKISGKGIELLRKNGVIVDVVNCQEFYDLNKFFFTGIKYNRPFILLKWAESANGYFGSQNGNRILISNRDSQNYVHYLRSKFQAIMIGKNTAINDNPGLDTRYFPGKSPVKIIMDLNLECNEGMNLFKTPGEVVIINQHINRKSGRINYFKPDNISSFQKMNILLAEIYQRLNIGSILVEGGKFLLQQFISQGIYDEIHLIKSPLEIMDADIEAPVFFHNNASKETKRLGNDLLSIYRTGC